MGRIGGRQRTSIQDGAEEPGDLFVQALARGLTILALFDVEHPEWSLGEICRKTGISKTTAYRMVRTLEYKGFLTFDSRTERYRLGRATIPSAYLALSNFGFTRSVHSFLEELAAGTGETVELAVEGDGGAVVVDQVATSHPFKPNLPLGRVLRNLANSSMKVIVAYRPEVERDRILKAPQAKLTPKTVVDPDSIQRELTRVVRDGLAYDIEEQDIGVCAVSAPIFGPGGDVRAVVSVIAPAERFGFRERRRIAEAAKKTATEIGRSLGQTATAVD